MTAAALALHPRHRAELERGSGIPPEAIAAWRPCSVDRAEDLVAAGFLPQQWAGPGMLLPVLGPEGRNGLEVYKPDTSPIGKDGRARKYLIPAGAGARIHFPPSVRPVLGDPRVPLLITEGLKKAEAGAARGLATIGLMGTWMFKGKNDVGAVTILADLDAIAWEGRQVLIVFDSDATRKPGVAMAAERLAVILERRGAKVRIVQLPDRGDGAKMGLDDYLLEHEPAELRELAEQGRPRTLYTMPYDRERARLEAEAERAEIALLLKDRPELLRRYEYDLDRAERAELYREQLERSNAALGLVHAVMTDREKPVGARAAFLATWLVNRADPDRAYDYQPDLAKVAGMKATDTFRNHLKPFCEGEGGPVQRVSYRETVPDPNAPQGVRFIDRVRYDLRYTDDMEALRAYLQVQVEPKERKKPAAAERPDPCEHPNVLPELAEVDRCLTCDAVLDVRFNPLHENFGRRVEAPSPPPDELRSEPPPVSIRPKDSGDGETGNDRRGRNLGRPPYWEQLDWGSKQRWELDQSSVRNGGAT